MVRVIMGAKGTGKTKQMIDLINYSVDNEIGSVICVEPNLKMTFDLSNKVRLIDASTFASTDFTFLKGFISGLYASNYDITHVFLDSLCKIIPSDPSSSEVEQFLQWLNVFAETNGVKFTITISADASLATETMKTYF